MDSLFLVWLAAKIFLYGVMAAWAMSQFRLLVARPGRFVAAWTAFRVCIGLLSSLIIVSAWEKLSPAIGPAIRYSLSFGVVRYFEWLATLALICLRHRPGAWAFGLRGHVWIFVGVAVNVLLDRVAVLLGFTDFRIGC